MPSVEDLPVVRPFHRFISHSYCFSQILQLPNSSTCIRLSLKALAEEAIRDIVA
jgi:hypothetical protein